MFPERDLATEFWFFVREQAIDPRSSDSGERRSATMLDRFESDRRFAIGQVADLLPPEETDTRSYPDGEPKEPWLYPSMQEALIAFLIEQVGATLNFPYTYQNWLRTVALVLGDAVREPGWLHLISKVRSEDPPYKLQPTEHTMAISDDWSCILPETFDFILRRFQRKDCTQ